MEKAFEPIETQEALDARISEAVKRYEGWLAPDEVSRQTKALNHKIDDLVKELETSKAAVADLTAKNTALETDAAKLKIAHEEGLPYELAQRLSGSNEEELRKDAQTLAQFARSIPPAPQFNPEKPLPDARTASLNSMLNDLF